MSWLGIGWNAGVSAPSLGHICLRVMTNLSLLSSSTAGVKHGAAASYLETLPHPRAEDLGLAKMAHLFLQRARRELPERKAGSRGGTCETSEEG